MPALSNLRLKKKTRNQIRADTVAAAIEAVRKTVKPLGGAIRSFSADFTRGAVVLDLTLSLFPESFSSIPVKSKPTRKKRP